MLLLLAIFASGGLQALHAVVHWVEQQQAADPRVRVVASHFLPRSTSERQPHRHPDGHEHHHEHRDQRVPDGPHGQGSSEHGGCLLAQAPTSLALPTPVAAPAPPVPLLREGFAPAPRFRRNASRGPPLLLV